MYITFLKFFFTSIKSNTNRSLLHYHLPLVFCHQHHPCYNTVVFYCTIVSCYYVLRSRAGTACHFLISVQNYLETCLLFIWCREYFIQSHRNCLLNPGNFCNSVIDRSRSFIQILEITFSSRDQIKFSRSYCNIFLRK